MESLLWATGSMFLVMLIVQFIPIGLTKKGKVVTVLAAFFLAMAGLLALSTFSLWKIILMLFVLIFFTSYLLNTRLGASLFENNHSFGKKLIDQGEHLIDYNKSSEQYEPFRLNRMEVASTIEHVEEIEGFDAGLFYAHNSTEKEVEISEISSEVIEDDILFVLNRNIDIEEELESKEVLPENAYLTDIERLLTETSIEEPNVDQLIEEPLEEDELPILTFDHVPTKADENTDKTNPLEELEELPLLTFEKK
jgi:hypothetical protein